MIKSIFAIILLISFHDYLSPAQWMQTNGPNGVSVISISSSGTNTFVATYTEGIYYSTNNGLTWNKTVSQLSQQLSLRRIYCNGNYILISAQGANVQGGLFFSSNMGTNWSLILQQVPDQGIVSMMINNNRILAAADYYYGVLLYISDNFGLTWDTIQVANCGSGAFGMNGNMLYMGGVGYNSVQYHLFESSNNGDNWIPLIHSPYRAASILFKDNIFFVFQYNSDSIFKSTDNGMSWSAAGTGIPSDRVISDWASDNNNIYIGTYTVYDGVGGIFKSSNNGSSWIPSGLTPMFIYGMSYSGNKILAGTYDGMFVSSDDGNSWTNSNTGFPFLNISSMCKSGGRFFAASTNEALYYTTNDGVNWITSNYPYAGLAVVSYNNRMVTSNSETSFYSLDNGDNWSHLLTVPGGVPRISTAGITGSSFLVDEYTTNDSSNGQLWVTTNNGATWSFFGFPRVRFFSYNGTNVFSATAGGVFFSTNDGLNWINISSGLPTQDILSISSNDNFIVAGTNGFGIYKSTNNGGNWVPINSGISNSSIYSIALSGNNIFIGTNITANKIYMSLNEGASWVPIDGTLTNFSVNALAVDTNYLYVATAGSQGGVWRMSLSGLIGIQSYENHIPNKFSLSQNYPNPFNPSTNIKFDVPASPFPSQGGAMNVTLKVYDILGREIATLVNEKLNPGTYKVEWNASNYSSDVYFYKLETAEFNDTRKMILIK